MFAYFTCFTKYVWLLLLLSWLILALVLSIKCKNIAREIYKNIWDLFIRLYQNSLQEFVVKHKSLVKGIIGVWTVSALILSIQFTGFLLDYMKYVIPVRVIDSLEDLSKWDGIKIYVANDSTLYDYATKEASDSLAQAINKRMIAYPAEQWFEGEFRTKVIRELKTGSSAIEFNRMTALFVIFDFSRQDEPNGSQPLTDILRVSRYGSGIAPGFATINGESDQFVTKEFNQMEIVLNNLFLFVCFIIF